MNNWKIEYLCSAQQRKSPIEIFLDRLSDEQFKSVAKELKLLSLCGNTLRLPHSKSLGHGLFELRECKFGYRIYYTFMKGQIIVLLHVGSKSSQNKDIKIAKELLLKVLQRRKI